MDTNLAQYEIVSRLDKHMTNEFLNKAFEPKSGNDSKSRWPHRWLWIIRGAGTHWPNVRRSCDYVVVPFLGFAFGVAFDVEVQRKTVDF